MTRKEAIERLKNYTQYRCGGVDLVAINMAIKALEQEPCDNVLDKIIAEIQGLRNCSCSCSDGIIDDVEDIIDKYMTESDEQNLKMKQYPIGNVFDKIRAEMENAYEDLDEYDPDALPTYIDRVSQIIDKYAEQKDMTTLDKIRAEIKHMDFDFGDFYDHTDQIIEKVCEVIDKCRAESEV